MENLLRFVATQESEEAYVAEFPSCVEEKVSFRAGKRMIVTGTSPHSPIHQTAISLFQVVTTERSNFGMQPMTIPASKPCKRITKRCIQLPFHQTGKSSQLEATEATACF